MKYLFFDVECGNCYNKTGKICSFGYVLTDDKFNVIKKDDILINHDDVWDKYVKEHIIQYNIKIFKNKPKFNEVFDEIKSLMMNDETICFGFDCNNDMKYLNDECERYHLEKLMPKLFDIQDIQKVLNGDKNGMGLVKLVELYNINYDQFVAHNSRDDAEMSMLVLIGICKKYLLSLEQLLIKYKKIKKKQEKIA